MKKFLLMALCIVAWAGSHAQITGDSAATYINPRDTAWKTGGFMALNFNQISLTNWAAGGQSAFSAVGVVNLYANYKYGRDAWDNTLNLGYGLIKNQGERVHKNEDKIELNSMYGRKAWDHWYYSSLLNFRTQFYDGYNYPNDTTVTSRFLAPAYISLALGLEYKPNDYFSLFLSPATGKFTFVNDRTLANQGAYGVDGAIFDTSGNVITPGKKYRAEFGASIQAIFKKDVTETINIQTKLLLFNNYTDKVKENRGNIDVNWDFLLNMKVSKYITTTLFLNLIYDHDIKLPTFEKVNGEEIQVGEGPKIQFKEVFGVGLSYKFANRD